MPTSYSDIFDAILSMDSYNRTENQGVFIFGSPDPNAEENSSIGDYKIIKVSDPALNTEHSFYAVAYQKVDASGNATGPVIISYRGTDNPNPLNANSDFYNGWASAAGLTNNNQAGLALSFYQDVLLLTGHSADTPYTEAPSDFVFTGHSLGGGLAGFVASLTHGTAVVFDHMPFEVLALAQYSSWIADLIARSPEASAAIGATSEDYATRYNEVLENFPQVTETNRQLALSYLDNPPSPPEWSEKIQAFHVEGEMLQYLRSGDIPSGIGAIGGALGGFAGAAISAVGAYYGDTFYQLDAPLSNTALSVYDWEPSSLLPAVDLHSQALQVALLYEQKYGEEKGYTLWHNPLTATSVLNALFNNDVGEAIGLSVDGTGKVAAGDQMLRMIAYSAIESGTLVFGNSAISTLFNDADDLGFALGITGNTIEGLAPSLAQILAQFSGQLAYNKVVSTDHPEVLDGVISLDNGGQVLTVDLSTPLWQEGNTHELWPNIFGRTEFLANLGYNLQTVDNTQMTWLWGTNDKAIFDRFAFAIDSTEALNGETGERAVESTAPAVTVVLGTDSGDHISGTSTDDLIVGGAGADFLDGKNGDDLIDAGSGDDRIIVGTGKKYVLGGSGSDTVVFSDPGALYHRIDAELGHVDVSSVAVADQARLIDVERIEGSAANETFFLTSGC